jgi:hypothetical protein
MLEKESKRFAKMSGIEIDAEAKSLDASPGNILQNERCLLFRHLDMLLERLREQQSPRWRMRRRNGSRL